MSQKPKKKTIHASRYAQFDEAFLRYLERYLPGFKQQPDKVRLELCGMIDAASTRYRKHSRYDGYSRFTWEELEQSFGRGGFTAINQALGLFEVLREGEREVWSKVGGYSKAYRLTPRVAEIRANFQKGVFRRGATRLMTQDGKYLQSLPASALLAKNKNGQNRSGFHGLPVESRVPVNLVQIKKLLVDIEARQLAHHAGLVQQEMFSQVPDIEFLRDLHQDAAGLVSKARSAGWPGYVLHRYQEIESGRLYAVTTPNLQNCYRVLREAAMAGLYDVDIENCHYSILAQMAAEHGYQVGAVQEYLADKGPFREALATEFGITVQQAKDALIALIYGAKFSNRAKDALPKIFNGDTELAGCIYQHPKFLALRDDIAGARAAVLKGQVVSRVGTIKNCRGLSIKLSELNERQQLAHLLQGVESAALEAAYRLYPDQIALLQHDGFTSTKPLDTERIEAAMFEATGYRLEVEQKVIQVNLDKAFDKHPNAPIYQNAKQEFLQ